MGSQKNTKCTLPHRRAVTGQQKRRRENTPTLKRSPELIRGVWLLDEPEKRQSEGGGGGGLVGGSNSHGGWTKAYRGGGARHRGMVYKKGIRSKERGIKSRRKRKLNYLKHTKPRGGGEQPLRKFRQAPDQSNKKTQPVRKKTEGKGHFEAYSREEGRSED